MKITVIGTGNMGSAFVKQLSQVGHAVRVTGRDVAKAQAIAKQYPRVEATTAAQAVGDSEIVVLATGYGDAVEALRSVGNLTGKTVIDITNPLTADYMSLTIGHETSAAEEIARAVPGAEVVKAFNTLFAQVLADGPAFANGQRGSVFFAGDSSDAKARVKSLIESLGFQPVDAGGLKNARYLEPLAGLNIYFGYGAGMGTSVAPAWISK
ncbi:NADPH-dependent F420 reductase [Pandoraea sp. XJJ-1]|uniref:NADPH-dependent F420 reductase n=1 Tax=Pandoraea sp. XJJ-1 TaxID=3002643 RepID=UPI0022809F50|nr:NADPH-dependent F420 reductase [Pandoraea sp. XJJ-1]WAL84003.1 NADPH-dependent F420 reductase [Pandoraea sp. XJJ-1]